MENSEVKLDIEGVMHRLECTWVRHIDAGETPPGQSFWGQLNYIWCHSFCKRPIGQIDFATIYGAGRRKSWFHRIRYNSLVRRAIKENSEKLKEQALSMTGRTMIQYGG